jgi:hypothetical protein
MTKVSFIRDSHYGHTFPLRGKTGGTYHATESEVSPLPKLCPLARNTSSQDRTDRHAPFSHVLGKHGKWLTRKMNGLDSKSPAQGF